MSKIGPVAINIPQRQGILIPRAPEVIEPITVKSTVRDTGQTPDTALRGGMMLVEETLGSGGPFIRADDPAAPKGDPATVLSVIVLAGELASQTPTFDINHGLTVGVLLSAGANTAAQVAAELNADQAFNAELFADVDGGGFLRIRTIRGGPSTHIKATGPAGVFALAPAVSAEDAGVFPKFAVLNQSISILEPDGTAADQTAEGIVSNGRFLEADLIGASALGKLALSRRSCLFE